MAVIAVARTDVVAYRVIKPLAARPRLRMSVVRRSPSRDLRLQSNHATNGAAAAVASVAYPVAMLVFAAVAALITSRVYCGVHIPRCAEALIGVAVAGPGPAHAGRRQRSGLSQEAEIVLPVSGRTCRRVATA